MRFFILVVMTLTTCSMVGCEQKVEKADVPFDVSTYENFGPEDPNFTKTYRTLDNGEPSHITVQHILVGFVGSVTNKAVKRNQEEAKKLADKVLAEAKAGEQFDALVAFHSDDTVPGHYKLANHAVVGDYRGKDKTFWTFERHEMAEAFGDVSFKLEVGEIGFVEFDAEKSPLGWHIIKRIK